MVSNGKGKGLNFFVNVLLHSEDTLIIDPPKQEVEPETFVQLKVTLIPNIVPSFYEGEIEFSITWLDRDSPAGNDYF